jgi:hypothetical protein
MKIQNFLLPLLLLIFLNSIAQNNATITVKAGTTIKESVPVGDLYEYPRFIHGTVFFRDGKSSAAPMNYNRFLDEMQFIRAKGDTLVLINQKNISFVNIAKDTFFYDQGYVKLVTAAAPVKLGTKQTLVIISKEKIGAYNMPSSNADIDNYSSFNDGRKDYSLTVMQNTVLAKRVNYYFADNYNHFVLATKKNLVKLFPKQESAVNNYLKDSKVVFNNKDDLEKLVQYLSQL